MAMPLVTAIDTAKLTKSLTTLVLLLLSLLPYLNRPQTCHDYDTIILILLLLLVVLDHSPYFDTT